MAEFRYSPRQGRKLVRQMRKQGLKDFKAATTCRECRTPMTDETALRGKMYIVKGQQRWTCPTCLK